MRQTGYMNSSRGQSRVPDAPTKRARPRHSTLAAIVGILVIAAASVGRPWG